MKPWNLLVFALTGCSYGVLPAPGEEGAPPPPASKPPPAGAPASPQEAPPPPPRAPEPGCPGIDPQGQCRGTTAIWCEGGEIRSVDCATINRPCEWIDDDTGFYCGEPDAPGGGFGPIGEGGGEDDELPPDEGAPPPPAPAQMETVPIEAVHVMVSNNIEVKKCFVPLFKAGALPPRVDAKFTISPAGQASGVTLLQQPYRGTELEACLGRAIATIRFPAASKGTAITYPFVMQ